jgi:hypothetical protein
MTRGGKQYRGALRPLVCIADCGCLEPGVFHVHEFDPNGFETRDSPKCPKHEGVSELEFFFGVPKYSRKGKYMTVWYVRCSRILL